MNPFKKVFVITGAAGGIGREIAREIINRGGSVFAVDIDEKGLLNLPEYLNASDARLKFLKVDVTDINQVNELPERVLSSFGQVDGLFNVAGVIHRFGKISELDYPAIERVMKINFYGTLYMTKAFLPILLQRSEAHIVNISSMAGLVPVPGQAIYSASKAAVKTFTEALYAELKNTPVRVTVAFPGATQTDIARHSGVEVKMNQKTSIKPLRPEVVAKKIVDGMVRNYLYVITGKDSKTMNILYRMSPKFAVNYIAKKMSFLLD